MAENREMSSRAAMLALVLATLVTSCSDTPEAGPVVRPGAEGAEVEVEVDLERVASGLRSPLGIAHPGDGSERLFVVEQDGTIAIVDDGEVRPEPFLDVSGLTEGGGEQGLLGLAFHPEYATNGRLFVNYTDLEGDTVIAEYASATETTADPDSARVLLTIDQPFANHNGGHLAFGPDGYLYIGMGDGGGGGDPEGNGQDLGELLGKMLRIDVDGEPPYEIPEGNPFEDASEGLPEIWAYGLRNPWRFSFDRSTGDLWIADVGQSDFEEINRTPAGAGGGLNYGWPIMEGAMCFDPPTDCDTGDSELPIAVYDHDEGCSVTGGFVYRGEGHANLEGLYIFGDFCSGNIWSLEAERADSQEPALMLQSELSISSFGEDEEGELYMTDLGGDLWRIVSK